MNSFIAGLITMLILGSVGIFAYFRIKRGRGEELPDAYNVIDFNDTPDDLKDIAVQSAYEVIEQERSQDNEVYEKLQKVGEEIDTLSDDDLCNLGNSFQPNVPEKVSGSESLFDWEHETGDNVGQHNDVPSPPFSVRNVTNSTESSPDPRD